MAGHVAGWRSIGTLVVGAAALTACGSGHSTVTPTTSRAHVTSPGNTTNPTRTTAAPVAPTPACHMPLTHDTYDGFHVAVPAGWDVYALQGRVEVKKDASETEAVVVVPALQTNGLTPDAFFTSTFNGVQQQVQSGGGTFTVTATTSSHGVPERDFTASVGGTTLAGKATVMALPLTTPLSSRELVFAVYWAPAASFASEAPTLQSVAQCFGPEKGSLFSVVRDQVFTYELPPGWTVGDESQNTIDLHHGTDADVSYLLAETLPAQAGSSPQAFIDYVLGQENVTAVNAIATVGGGSQSTEYEEFTGTLSGVPVHGVISGQLSTGVAPSGVIRLALANQDVWNSMTGALVQMAGFIQHDFTQDLQQLQQINRQWQNFSNQVANFDDTLNNQQLVQDPSTGKLYEAPYAAYGDGPRGPGYYLDNGVPGGQLLDEVQRG